MKTAWQAETGHLECRWSELVERAPHDAGWMCDTAALHTSYLRPTPDFASHSPFGGPTWFQPGIELDPDALTPD